MKLYQHKNKFTELEFINLYNQSKGAGVIGPMGLTGLPGKNGLPGLNGTVKSWTKFLVTTGFTHRFPGYQIGFDATWSPGNPVVTKSSAASKASYLNSDFFMVRHTIPQTTDIFPIFRSTTPLIVLRFYIHFIEHFFDGEGAHTNSVWYSRFGYTFAAGHTGFGLYAARPADSLSYHTGNVGRPFAWTGAFNDCVRFGINEYAPGTLLFPRTLTDYSDEQVPFSPPIQVNHSDPRYEQLYNGVTLTSPIFGQGYGGLAFPEGLQLNFEGFWQSFQFHPGGPIVPLDQVDDYPLGGGVLMFTMLYQEF